MRKFLLVAPVVVLLAGCSLFGGGKKELSEEEKASRVTVNPFQDTLTPDATLAATTIALPAPTPATDWPQAGITAYKVPGHLDAAPQFKIDWRIGAGSGSDIEKRLVAAPVVKDNRIYVMDSSQKISAFDANSGKHLWSHQLESLNRKNDGHSVGGGLAIAGDKLIASSGYAYVVALSLANGSQIWQRPVDSPMSGSAAIMGNRAFVTSTNNEFYALDTDTGEIVWNDQAIAESARVLSSPSPAVTPDILAVPYSSGELIAYLPANGRRLWSDTLTATGRYTPLSVINDISGKPAIQDGVVYAASYSGILAAIDARSGARIWDETFGSRQGPVIGGDYLFVVGTDSRVACFHKIDGKLIWIRSLPEFKDEKALKDRIVWTGPLLVSNRLIVVSSQGKVLALSPQNGETQSELDVGQTIYIEPIAASGKIFVLTDQGTLVAIK
jgi:outer membrane protein assembly factor BamB